MPRKARGPAPRGSGAAGAAATAEPPQRELRCAPAAAPGAPPAAFATPQGRVWLARVLDAAPELSARGSLAAALSVWAARAAEGAQAPRPGADASLRARLLQQLDAMRARCGQHATG
jgi:hypothetical protein